MPDTVEREGREIGVPCQPHKGSTHSRWLERAAVDLGKDEAALAESLGTDGAALYQREGYGWQPITGRPPETSSLPSTAEVQEDVRDPEDEAGVA